MIIISSNISIADGEIEIIPIRAQGAGGQNVNKVSSAVHLRFDITQSGLPDYYKERLLNLSDQRITKDGIVVIKAQRFRTQEKNKEEAIRRLTELIKSAGVQQKTRRPTKPTKASKQRRVDQKTQRSRVKSLRGKVDSD